MIRTPPAGRKFFTRAALKYMARWRRIKKRRGRRAAIAWRFKHPFCKGE
jgi:hypothetical protein